jgi:hypothetical protein
MITQGEWMVVVTYSEWLNWMARGELRLNTRIAKVACPEDYAGFAQLMNRAPDLRIDDEQGFVLACLDSNFRSLLADVPGTQVPEVSTLSLKAVNNFLPVTERAARLLAGDARRAQARLGEPLFESAWRKWTADKQKADADRRGRTLSSALGVASGDLSLIPPKVLSYLLGEQRLPNADHLGEYEGGRAYGWVAAFGLLADLSSNEFKKDITERLGLRSLIRDLKNDYAFDRPILEAGTARTTAVSVGAELREKFMANVVIEQLVVFWHYEQQLRRGKNIELDALVMDIATLHLHCSPTVAANTTWLIGRLMEETAVSGLLYAATPSDWPTMAPTGSQQKTFDVVLAVQRMQQEITNDSATDPSNERKPNGLTPACSDEAAEPPSASQPSVGSGIDSVFTEGTIASDKEVTDDVTAAPVSAPLDNCPGSECVPSGSATVSVAKALDGETDSVSGPLSTEAVQEIRSATPSPEQQSLGLEDKPQPSQSDNSTPKTGASKKKRSRGKGATP